MANTVLEESILTSIKKLLGITEAVTVFDMDVAFHINTVFANLAQMGVGPKDADEKVVSIRLRDKEEKVKLSKLADFLKDLK